ncbi:MAG TPA: M48 family metalloprotease [Bauldia sp.]|nr:M48 family metalloprotease [Bauldia sp.]
MLALSADQFRFGRTLAALLAAGLLLAGCTSAGKNSPTAAIFGADSGAAINGVDTQEHSRIVAAYGGIYHDAKVEQTLVPIVSRIVASSDRPDQAYRITILNSPAINAFALPGGYLYVTRGLLALANDSSEVAAVLAHEMGHITANHAAARQNKAREALIVSKAVSEVLQDDNSGQLALASSQRTLASFSRQQELEADAIGVRTIGKAGYDPFAASRFLTAMAHYSDFRASQTLRDKAPDFLASHPSTPERVDFAEKAARQFGAPGIGETDRDRYLSGIDGMVFGDDPGQGFVRDRTFIHPGLAIGFTVPDGFVIDNTSDAVLATGVDGTALRFDAVGLATGTDLVEYLKSGWINGLDENSIQSFSVNGLQAASAEAQAKGWFFQIAVIKAQGAATYRFIFANETANDTFRKEAQQTTASFRSFTPQELAQLKALHIHIVTAVAGDTEAIVARRMHGVDRPRELFRALNDLDPGDAIQPGTKLKIVDDR